MRIGNIFHCGGKTLSLLPFHLATKQENVLTAINISLENARLLPDPTLQKYQQWL